MEDPECVMACHGVCVGWWVSIYTPDTWGEQPFTCYGPGRAVAGGPEPKCGPGPPAPGARYDLYCSLPKKIFRWRLVGVFKAINSVIFLRYCAHFVNTQNVHLLVCF
jgi:hypothetical protein